FTFLSGPMTNTERTVAVADAFGWIISYNSATLRSLSAIIGKSTSQFCVSLISFIQLRWSSTGSTLNANTLTFRFSNSDFNCAVRPNSVVQTGVKSEGWEYNTPHLPSIYS